jgi:hypothetical protein
VVAFLVSGAASFMTGAVVPADGGRRLSRRPDPLGAQDPRAPDARGGDARAGAGTGGRPPSRNFYRVSVRGAGTPMGLG